MRSHLSRGEAANYIRDKGFPCSKASLAKLAVVGGGPRFVKFGRFPRYTAEALDTWISSKLMGPFTSTSGMS